MPEATGRSIAVSEIMLPVDTMVYTIKVGNLKSAKMGYKSSMGGTAREKKGILAESTGVTFHHSKTSIRLLNRGSKRVSEPWLGLPLSCMLAVTGVLRVVCNSTGHTCRKRLQPSTTPHLG